MKRQTQPVHEWGNGPAQNEATQHYFWGHKRGGHWAQQMAHHFIIINRKRRISTYGRKLIRTDDVHCNRRVWEKLWAAVPLGSRQAVSEPTCLSVKLECCQKSSNYCFGGTVYVVLLVCNLETCILQEGCRTYVPSSMLVGNCRTVYCIYILCG